MCRLLTEPTYGKTHVCDDTRMTYIDLIVKYDSYTRLLWIFHWRAWLLQHLSNGTESAWKGEGFTGKPLDIPLF